MNEEQRRQFIDAIETAFQSVGIDIYVQAPRLLGFIDGARPAIEASCSRESLERYFTSDEAMSDEWVQVVSALALAFPAIIDRYVKESVRKTAADLPTRSGPPNKVTPEMKREIVAKVAQLHSSGVKLGDAYLRIGQQFNLSKRTVQGVWQKRGELAQTRYQSMQDVWRLFEQGIKVEKR